MKTLLLSILFILSATCYQVKAATLSDEESLTHLYSLAAKNLIFSSPLPENDVLDLALRLEALVREKQDYENLFKIQQIAVNAYCIKWEIGLASNKAHSMYEEAKKLNSPLGIALSLQAIGNTYMFSNQDSQAASTYLESMGHLSEQDDSFIKIRLLLQQMQVSLSLNQLESMQRFLFQAVDLLEQAGELIGKEDYNFYIQCYQTLYDIRMKDTRQATSSLELLKKMSHSEGVFEHWYYFISSNYYDLMNDYPQALAYCDSTISVVREGGNTNELLRSLMHKARLYRKNGEKETACKIYGRVRSLGDTLDATSYSRQIDSLHVAYWVDQMAIENTAAHNRMLTRGILLGVLVLLLALWIIYRARRDSKRLIVSRKRLEEVRQESKDSIHSKSLFLSNMSHELRTPLNAIVGFSGLLASDDDAIDLHTRLQCSDLIKQNSDLLQKLVNDVVELSALKNKNMTFVYEECDAVSLCNNVIDTVEKVKRTSAKLCFFTVHENLKLYTDSGRIQQVLINLLINSTKFTKEGFISLKLDIDEEKKEALFTIEDTGCGIPLEKQPHIFERFEKLHEGVQGAGLGLSICQLIVEHVGGKIWIDSSYTEGARFVFTHPLNNESKEEVL